MDDTLRTVRVHNTIGWFALIVIVQFFVIVYFSNQKESYFIDEIYSYGLSNSYYRPFFTSIQENWDKWIGRDAFWKYLTVAADERFSYGAVYYNQAKDVHPPLYYWCLHTVCSFFPGEFSKWFGIGLNLVFFIISSVFLYLLAYRVFNDKYLALVPQVMWGGLAAINGVMFIRMYMLLTMFAVITLYVHIRMVQGGQSWAKLMAVFLVTLLGLLTQYYFVILAFFVSAIYCCYRIKQKQWQQVLEYSLSIVGAIVVMVAMFPAVFDHLFGDGFVGVSTRENVLRIGHLLSRVRKYGVGTLNSIFGRLYKPVVGIIATVTAIAIVVWLKERRMNHKAGENGVWNKVENRLPNCVFVVVITAIVAGTFVTIAQVSAVSALRYVYFVIPGIILCILAVFQCALRTIGIDSKKVVVIVVAFGCISYFGGVVSGDYRYIYPKRSEMVERIKNEYSSYYCIHFTEYHNAPVTQELMEFMHYRGVYLTPKESIRRLESILRGKDISQGLVVSIDTNRFWSSGYDADEVLNSILKTGLFTEYEELYSYGLVATYVVR